MSQQERYLSASYERFGGACAVAVGLFGFLYSIAFIILVVAGGAPEPGILLSSIFLILGGVFSLAVIVAVYGRLRETDVAFALLALLLVAIGAGGSAVHGGYDLANGLNPLTAAPTDLPSQINPRGLLTFGVSGLGILMVSWLIVRGRFFPRGLGYLGYVTGVLMLVLYLGRLIVVDPNNSIVLIPALLTGFIFNPAWYIWLGILLWNRRRP